MKEVVLWVVILVMFQVSIAFAEETNMDKKTYLENMIRWERHIISNDEDAIHRYIVWAKDRLVVGGKNHSIHTSTDGETWEVVSEGHPGWIGPLQWVGDRFFGMGFDVILSSKDGVNWKTRRDKMNFSPSDKFNDFIKQNELYSVVGSKRNDNFEQTREVRTAYSKDGITWTEKLYDIPGTLERVIWDGKKYVAAGGFSLWYGNKDVEEKTIIMISEDGKNWREVKTNINIPITDFYYLGGKYIGITYKHDGIIVTSDDLKNWNVYNYVAEVRTNSHSYEDVTYNGKVFVAVNEDGTIVVSKNAIDWEQADIPDMSDYADGLSSVIWNGDVFVAAGLFSSRILVSYDGYNWIESKLPDNLVLEDEDCIQKMIWTGKEFYGLTQNSKIVKGTIPIKVYIDGNKIQFDADPQIVNNTTMVPLRRILEEFDMTVEWDSNNKTILATKEHVKIELVVSSKIVKVNGKEKVLECEPKIINGTALIPVRFIAEILGCTVQWDDITKSVIIKSNI